jgi:hypothetical protein
MTPGRERQARFRQPPYAPGSPARRTPARAGNHLQVGFGDILACGRTWAKVLSATT